MTKRALSCEWKLIAKGFLPSLFIWFESVLESFGQDIVKYQWCEFCPYLCGVKLRGMVISHLLLCPCKLPLVWASAKKRRSWKSKAAVSNRRVNKSLWYNQLRYKHQCYCVVDCILQISFSSYRLSSPYLSINHSLQKSEAFQSVHHVTFILCYTVL